MVGEGPESSHNRSLRVRKDVDSLRPLGHNACLRGIRVRYYRISRLFLALAQAKADGSYRKLLGQLGKTGLLIIDDWGLEKLSQPQRYDLMEILDDRYGESSTVMISQLPVSEWTFYRFQNKKIIF